MEQIVKKVETTSTITVYQAIDGTEFSSKEECLKYEGTVECLLLTKYNRLVKRRVSEDELFNTGSDECMIDILQPLSSEADIDIIIQLYKLYGYYSSNYSYDGLRSRLEKYLENKDTILIGRGPEYDKCKSFYIVSTLQTIINNIVKDKEDK